MTVDLHPEELLERERAGELSHDEQRRLDEHVRSCTACAFERRAAGDFKELLEPFAGDDALVARLVENVRSAPRPSRFGLRRVSVAPLPRRRVPKLAFVLAAALAAGIAAAAAYTVVAPRWRAKAPALPSAPTPSALPRAGGVPLRSAAEAPSATETPSASSVEIEPQAPAPKGSATAPSAASGSADSDLTAGELFARGNKARRSGSYGEAVRLYGELQRRFPASREAHTSELALGWLMLNQLGNPSGALGQFNGYLAGGGVMSEEALSGRALALQRLGRSSEERRAWEDLLARYPGSVNAERAKKRLEALK